MNANFDLRERHVHLQVFFCLCTFKLAFKQTQILKFWKSFIPTVYLSTLDILIGNVSMII